MHKMFLWIAALAALSTQAFALDTIGNPAGGLAGYRFVLVEANGAQPVGEREIYFDVDDSMMLAGRICNNFRGQGELKGDILSMAQGISTRMMCMNNELSELESMMLGMLNKGALAVLAGDRLTLRRDGATLVFERTDRKAQEEGKEESRDEAKAETAAPGATAVSRDDLVGRKFILKTTGGEAFVLEMGEQPFIEFRDPFLVAGSACNSFRGPGELENGVLTVENAAATMKMCVDPKLVQYERDFHALLRQGAKITLEGGTLTLSGDSVVYTYELE